MFDEEQELFSCECCDAYHFIGDMYGLTCVDCLDCM